MSILVTGSKGGLGRSFVPILRAHYDEPVICSARISSDEGENFSCDFTDKLDVAHLIKNVRPRLIFHLVGSFTGQFELDYQCNTLAAKYIFDSILIENLKTRVVVFGSAAEYGVIQPSDNPVSESLPCRPVSAYGLTKAFQTEMATFYARTKNIDAVIARVFNLAMPGLSQKLFYGKAEAMITAFKKGEVTQLEFGNLESERDYIELDRAAEQLLSIAEHGIAGEIYNVGSGISRKMRSLLTEMLIKEGVPDAIIVESSPDVIKGKGIDVPIIYADIRKVSKLMSLS